MIYDENGSSSVAGNSELDLITKDIEELTKEKQQLEHDITQKEADIRIKNGEIKLLGGELTTLAATLKQLENQKGEAQKRLDDLDSQRTVLDRNLDDLKKQLDEELEKVNTLKKHLHDQESSLKSQEEEIVTKRTELNDLKAEESKLENNIQAGKSQFDTLNKSLQDTLLQISQTKAKITQLQEHNRQLADATSAYDNAISNEDASGVSDSMFKLQPMFMDPEYSNLSTTNASSGSGFSMASSGFEDDPFKDKDPFTETNGFTVDPFVGYDPFKDDPFKSGNGTDDLFGKPFVNNPSDPFKDGDPFSGSFPIGKTESDPFGGDAFSSRPASNPASNGDMFESDPFGPPPVAPRNESPTPVLPPKKSKQPPPRPAPPRSAGTKTRAAPPAPSPDPFADVANGTGGSVHSGSLSGASNTADPFASAFGSDPFEPFGSNTTDKDPFASGIVAGGTDSFANFADFDSKFSQLVPSEEEQLAWAKQESVRLERDRQKRAAEREQAELDLALALSKAEAARRA
ncbi:Epidermal growth factor receptor substrate 15-like 1 [Chamberlinius hualienensis]